MIQSFRMAMRSIAGNKFRSFLTMLGIIIGVMALVILVSLVSGATGTVTDTISGLGNNMITVTVNDDKGKPVTLKLLDEWMDEEEIGAISVSETESFTGKYDSSNMTVTVCGTTPAYADINGLNILLGRFIKSPDVDNHTYMCVINETAASELIGYTDCLGTQISLDGIKFTVEGVLEDDEDSLTSAFSGSSAVVYIPYSTMVRISSSSTMYISDFTVGAAQGYDIETAETSVTELLTEYFDGDGDAFDISSQNVIEEAMGSITSVMTILLGGIAGISLLVGGIGIMNIMLVTVTERTREIGIRKAIGAGHGAILLQFLMESVVLCMLGCAAGVFLSWAVLRIITVLVSGLSLTFAMSWGVVAVAVIFCFLIGVLFGLYPANKAARMAPIDALHYGG